MLLLPVSLLQNYPPDTPRDVWLQLLRCCLKSPKCRPHLPDQLHRLQQQLHSTQRALQLLHSQAAVMQLLAGSSLVSVQLKLEELRQHTSHQRVVQQDIQIAVRMVGDAVEGSADSC